MPKRRHGARSGLLAVATLLALAPFGASAAAATATLSQRTLSLPIGRLLLLVPVTGDLRYRLRDGRAEIDGRLTADLAEVRQRAPAVLSALLADSRAAIG